MTGTTVDVNECLLPFMIFTRSLSPAGVIVNYYLSEIVDFIPDFYLQYASVLFCFVVCRPFFAILSDVCRQLTVSGYKHFHL